MPDPNMEMYLDSDGSKVTALNPVQFSLIEKGSVSDTITVWVWNDKDGVLGSDTAVTPNFSALHGSGDASIIFDGTAINSYVSMLEARSCGAQGVAADLITTWTPIAPDQILTLGDIPSNTAREIELRVNVPQDSSVLALVTFSLRVSV